MDYTVREVKVADVQRADLAVTKAGASQGCEDRPAPGGLALPLAPSCEPDRGARCDTQFRRDPFPGVTLGAHMAGNLGAQDRLLRHGIVDPRCGFDQREQLIRLQEVGPRHRRVAARVGCRVRRAGGDGGDGLRPPGP